jgi:TPP-dependent pyruvate/acetoin dehydrogenase alpha subunit
MAFFGEGAVHAGAFHEGMVLAVAWQAPVMFVCENNQYAEFTRTEGAWGGPGVVERAAAYGVAATSVDGNDVRAVEASVAAAVASARSGSGPAFLEMRTFRMGGHYEGDAEPYRAEGELEEWAQRDPIARVRSLLAEAGREADAEAAAAAARAEIETAVERALSAPYPDPETVLEYVGG